MSIMHIHNHAFAQQLSTSEITPLSKIKQEVMRPVWSPDASMLAVSSPGNNEIIIYKFSNEQVSTIAKATGIGFGFQWSPDASTIVTRETRFENRRNQHAVLLISVVNAQQKRLTDFLPSIPDLPVFVGNDVIYKENESFKTISNVLSSTLKVNDSKSIHFENNELKIYSSNGSQVIRTPFNQPLLNETLSPNGQFAAFEVYGGNCYVMNLNTLTLTDLGSGNRPSFSPNSDYVVFMEADDDGHAYTRSELVAVHIKSGTKSRLTDDFEPLAMNPAWSPNGNQIAFDSPETGLVYLLTIRTESN